MFFLKDKLEFSLNEALIDKAYKNYRVIIQCKTLLEKVENRIISMKCQVIHTISSLNCICAILTPRAIERLIEYPEVKHIGFDKYAFLCGQKNISANIKMSTLFSTDSRTLNNCNLNGKNIGIGLIDTGIYPHNDLISPENRISKFMDILNAHSYAYDDNGHGTFMAGLICGNGYLSKGINKGAAPRSHLYCIKAFNSKGKAFISDILFSLDYMLKEIEKYNIKVICLPFETFDYDPSNLDMFSRLFTIAIKRNVTIVVPSGSNLESENCIIGLATLSNCITVGGAYNSNSQSIYKYSSCGSFKKLLKPDLVYPCVNLCSLNSIINYIPQNSKGIKLYPPHLQEPYTNYTGTSCAAAYICGVCALLYEYNENLTSKDVLSLLKLACTPMDISKNKQGAGVFNLNKLLLPCD